MQIKVTKKEVQFNLGMVWVLEVETKTELIKFSRLLVETLLKTIQLNQKLVKNTSTLLTVVIKVIEIEKFIELTWRKKIKTIFRNKYRPSYLEFKWSLKVSNRDKLITQSINSILRHLAQLIWERVSITKTALPQSMNEIVTHLFLKIEHKLKLTVIMVSLQMVQKHHTLTCINPVFLTCTRERVATIECPVIKE